MTAPVITWEQAEKARFLSVRKGVSGFAGRRLQVSGVSREHGTIDLHVPVGSHHEVRVYRLHELQMPRNQR
tara:strand:+ start:856 stop:1068 length:213 start_codon:yes stop_codon:yes gene_type:complete